MYSIQHYVIKCLSVICDRSVVFSGFSGFHHQWNWAQRYKWYIVESGAKYHKTNQPTIGIQWTRRINYMFIFGVINVTQYICAKQLVLVIMLPRIKMLKFLYDNVKAFWSESCLRWEVMRRIVLTTGVHVLDLLWCIIIANENVAITKNDRHKLPLRESRYMHSLSLADETIAIAKHDRLMPPLRQLRNRHFSSLSIPHCKIQQRQ